MFKKHLLLLLLSMLKIVERIHIYVKRDASFKDSLINRKFKRTAFETEFIL